LDEHAGRDQHALGSQLGEDVGATLLSRETWWNYRPSK
jgi:hypothetical protein